MKCWHPYDGWTYPDYDYQTRRSLFAQNPLGRRLEDDDIPDCLMGCAHGEPNDCWMVENMETCLTTACSADDLVLSTNVLAPYRSCLCDEDAKSCEDVDIGAIKISPMDFEQDHTRTLKDTWNINVPPYAEDPLAKYFLFHQNSAKITSTYSSSDGAAYWDSAAAFIDMRVEYDKDANKCVPKVKVDSPDEEVRSIARTRNKNNFTLPPELS
jgi:hypothetical protein